MITGKCTDINVSLKAIPDAGGRGVTDQVFLHIVLPIRVLILKVYCIVPSKCKLICSNQERLEDRVTLKYCTVLLGESG